MPDRQFIFEDAFHVQARNITDHTSGSNPPDHMRFLSTLIASTLGTLLALGLIVILFFLFVMTLSVAMDGAPDVQGNSVLVMEMSGDFPEVAADDPFLRLSTGVPPQDMHRFRTNLLKAAADDRVSALWLQMNGLTASWAALEEMREMLDVFKESGKPVYASSDIFFMSETDYFVASAADSVFFAPQGIFELNGFALTAEFYAGLLDKLEVEPQVVRAGEYKSAVEPFTRSDLSEENREQLASLLENWNAVFARTVAEHRGLTSEEVLALASEGEVITAEDALEAGLVDDLLYDEGIENVIRRRIGLSDDEELTSISAGRYGNVTPAEAGIRTGDEGEIAVVHASGAMVSGDSGVEPGLMFGGVVVGSETFRKAMEDAADNDRVKAIVLRIDSPGGFTPAADAMWQATRLAAEKKPLLVSMGAYAASGGYWLATAADTIIADALTLTGSIGVYSIFFDAGGLFEDKLGITQVTSAAAAVIVSLSPILTTVFARV